LSKGVKNGTAEVSVTKVERTAGKGKVATLLKEEDLMVSEGEGGEIQRDEGTATESQKALPENPAVVSVGKKLTMNIGNYESVSVSVHLSMPCQAEKDAVNQMFEKVNMWVDRRIEAERSSVRRARSDG
jgi:hypothetical protein